MLNPTWKCNAKGQIENTNFAIYIPRTEWGERSCVGVKLHPAYHWLDAECKHLAHDPANTELEIFPCLYGYTCTWDALYVALYWSPEGTYSLGETLESWGETAHSKREKYWRTQCRKIGRHEEYLIREQDELWNWDFGLAGKIVSRIIITPSGKVNEGRSFRLSLANWYVFLNTIPHRPWAELEAAYADCPPQELRPVPIEAWHAPGAEPWSKDKIAQAGLKEVRQRLAYAYGDDD